MIPPEIRELNIALVGRMGAGKTTIAELLTLSSRHYQRVSHAEGIKEMARRSYGPVDKSQEYNVTSLHGDVESISGRQVLQRLGQTVKTFDRDFWIKATLMKTIELNANGFPVVNDDTRFIFEADMLREAGFVIAKVRTPEPIRMQRYQQMYGRLPTEAELNHESEQEVDLIAYDIEINGVQEPWLAMQELLHAAGAAR